MSDIPFEIGATVVPINNLEAPTGEEILTAGITGTVINRSFIYQNPDLNRDYYTYQVELLLQVALPSGASPTGSGNIFWFSEEDLGNQGPFSNITVIDIDLESGRFNEGSSKVDHAIGTIEQILSRMDTSSYYYDVVKAYLDSVKNHKEAMLNYNNTFSNTDSTEREGKAAGKQGEVLGFDADVFIELAENALGYHDVFKTIDEEFKSIEIQVKTQNTLALEDDAENFKAYYNAVAKGNGQNVLIPGGNNTNEAYSTQHRIDKQEFDELLTVSGHFNSLIFPAGTN